MSCFSCHSIRSWVWLFGVLLARIAGSFGGLRVHVPVRDTFRSLVGVTWVFRVVSSIRCSRRCSVRIVTSSRVFVELLSLGVLFRRKVWRRPLLGRVRVWSSGGGSMS